MGSKFLVRDLMTREVKTLRRNEKLSLADGLMTMERVRHLPVLEDDEDVLVGILSQRDLFRGALARSLGYGETAQRKLLDMLVVKEVMSHDPATIAPDASVSDAARLMLDRKIGCLVVVENDAVVGILTESDFVKLMVQEK